MGTPKYLCFDREYIVTNAGPKLTESPTWTRFDYHILDCLQGQKAVLPDLQTTLGSITVVLVHLTTISGFWLGFFLFVCFWGPHLWHLETPRLGVESEPQLPVYTIAHSNAGSLTHWARPEIKQESLWILVGLVTAEPQWDLLTTIFECLLSGRYWSGLWDTVANKTNSNFLSVREVRK